MELITHALASYALARAVVAKPPPRVTLLIVAAGLAPELDWFSRLGGPAASLRAYRTITHSLASAAALALVLALAFWLLERRRSEPRVCFLRALGLSALAISAHLLLDLTNSYGLALLWPFRATRFAWDLAEALDPLVLVTLLVGVLLPALFALITEEIGARRSERSGRGWAIAALVLVAGYGAVRFVFRERATTLLFAAQFHERTAIHAGAFPVSAFPFTWHGVVETDSTLEEVYVSVGPGAYFNPDRSLTHFKPEASSVLDAARKARTALAFLALARFPMVSVERTLDGYRAEFREIGYSPLRDRAGGYAAVIELDEQSRVTREELAYIKETPR